MNKYMMKKTLGVAGDSFMTSFTSKTPCGTQHLSSQEGIDGNHFTQLLSKKIDYNLYTLAKGGSCNYTIRLQVEELCKKQVDLILLGFSFHNRMIIPEPDKVFNIDTGIHNINYNSKSFISEQHIDHTLKTCETNTINSFLKESSNINDKQRTSLKMYVTHLYSSELKEKEDSFIIHSTIEYIRYHKIKTVVWFDKCFCKHLNFLKSDNVVHIIDSQSDLCPLQWQDESNYSFHTSLDAQQKGAKKWFKYLKSIDFI